MSDTKPGSSITRGIIHTSGQKKDAQSNPLQRMRHPKSGKNANENKFQQPFS
ncbi:hypothetical protein [Puniceibacterium sp. IMCC21224]|uniref:hypothetical protein n=1 Tax=Puniceibacterium sp. IMCC21224 TaxID=1618204 RepID=UPI0012E021FF|nr:hypothetical protein [Puniceibacterium sp. IMCC21224]